LNYA
jgi:hypothetical protein